MPDGVIFDFDGVIADTEPLHFRAFAHMMAPLGLELTQEEYYETYIGFDDRDVFRLLFERIHRGEELSRIEYWIDRKAEEFIRLVETSDVRVFPGVSSLIKELHGVCSVGLCSGALRSDVLPILKRSELEPMLDVIVTAEDVEKSKPDPACYVLARQQMDSASDTPLSPARIVAVEDTPAGIKAARGAGLSVLAITNTHPASVLQDADRIVPSLAGVGIETLEEILEAGTS